MEFKTQFDGVYLVFISTVVIILGAVLVLMPIVVMPERTVGLIISNSMFCLVLIWLIWSHATIRIRFEDDALVVRSGPFRFEQRYTDIQTVRKTSDFFTGKRVLTSRNGLAIADRNAIFELKISPQDQEIFLQELEHKVPQLRYIS